ncbi:ADP-ribosylglycohydrolase family protein [Arthrobacter sp. TMS2-4]
MTNNTTGSGSDTDSGTSGAPSFGDTPQDAPPAYEDRVLGCLLGTMAGDVYGLLAVAGDDPLHALDDPSDLAVSDATQLTLYTVDGLTDALEWANDGVAADETACLWLAYLRWLTRQGEHLPARAPAPPPRWLDRQEGLLPVRAPDADTVRALLTGEMGTRARPLNPDAEGAGALMRSAPFGLVPRIPASLVERLTVEAAALTHGSAAARATAARYSGIVRSLAIDGLPLDEAAALKGVADSAPAHRTPAERTGAATTATATLEVALHAARVGAASASPREQFALALASASATGRSDASTVVAASLAGGIIGALHGTAALPAAYLDAPGAADVVRSMARTLLRATTGR